MSIYDVLFIVLALPLALIAARYAGFALLALIHPLQPLPPREPDTKFCVLVPAHNESAGIKPTIAALQKIDYPAELFRVLVVADNCDDDTAAQAREAGADVIERNDPDQRGKGYALRWVIDNHLAVDEAMVVCDADSFPAADYLQQIDRAFTAGFGAAQGFNGTANPDASGLAALAAITGTMKNGLHYAGKASTGLPAPLMNGLALSADTLREHPWRAFSVAEDFETTLHLVDAGVKIGFVPETKIVSHKVGSFAAAAEQKARWSGGQSKLGREVALPLAAKGLREGSWAKFETALELLLPGYAPTTALLLVLALIAWLASPHWYWPGPLIALIGLALMVLQFLIGLTMIRWTPKIFLALLLAPFYLFWKLVLAVHNFVFQPQKWQRARRDD